jgi:integrase
VHSKPLDRGDIPLLLQKLNTYGGYRTTTIAMKLMLLTFVRTVELRAARWIEVDLERAEWRIPLERMKQRELHIVPLARQALVLLKELHMLTGGPNFPFPQLQKAPSVYVDHDAQPRSGKDGL